MLSVEALTVGPFQSNCYVAACRRSQEAILVDAGDDADAILAAVTRLSVRVTGIVCTHAHIDHIAALPALCESLAVPVSMHRAALPMYEMAGAQASSFGLEPPGQVEIDRIVEAGDEIRFGELVASVRWTPGHSPGGICLYLDLPDTPVLFAGDVLFQGSIGRTDLPGSDEKSMRATLRSLLALPDETRVYPGHGPDTTIGAERRSNPFLLPLAG